MKSQGKAVSPQDVAVEGSEHTHKERGRELRTLSLILVRKPESAAVSSTVFPEPTTPLASSRAFEALPSILLQVRTAKVGS